MAYGYSFPCSAEEPIKLVENDKSRESKLFVRMREVKANVELYGAEHALDLLILRGSGEQIDWRQESEVFFHISIFILG